MRWFRIALGSSFFWGQMELERLTLPLVWFENCAGDCTRCMKSLPGSGRAMYPVRRKQSLILLTNSQESRCLLLTRSGGRREATRKQTGFRTLLTSDTPEDSRSCSYLTSYEHERESSGVSLVNNV